MLNSIEEIGKQRQKEIREGKNLATAHPLYVVYDITQNQDIENYPDDRFVTCCFTRQAAEEYIERDRHNLNDPYIYVASVPIRNLELRSVCQVLGDKLPERKEV